MIEVKKNELGFGEFKSDNIKTCEIKRLKSNQMCVSMKTTTGEEYILWIDSETDIAGRFYSY